MKIGKVKKSKQGFSAGLANMGKPAKNQSKKTITIGVIILITTLLIVWVYAMGKKAEETVQVIMLKQNVYKNQIITESMLQPYDMLVGEFEKFSTTNENGVKQRRVFRWDERGQILNSFAAYPLKAGTYAEKRDFIKSRIDNSDNVLYSFPGKDIISLDIASSDLQAFKTFLQPGDRLNITGVYTERQTVTEDDGMGGTTKTTVEVFKTTEVFTDIMIADLLNSSGDSILDIYASYNDKSVWQQAQLDNSQEFKDSTEPKSLLIAVSPEEKERYNYYTTKSNIKFKISLPQRVD